ncbi:MAG: hypothetical protein RJA19_895 [Bacteroidota bacterium]|jgi:uncharacterized protein YceH (UPF0502 family)
MNLIQGQVDAAIRFLESQAHSDDREEDIAHRESRIRRLQTEMAQLRTRTGQAADRIDLRISIQIEAP